MTGSRTMTNEPMKLNRISREEFEAVLAEHSPKHRYHGRELDDLPYGSVITFPCTWNHYTAKTNQYICQGKSYMYRQASKRGYKVTPICHDKVIHVLKEEITYAKT